MGRWSPWAEQGRGWGEEGGSGSTRGNRRARGRGEELGRGRGGHQHYSRRRRGEEGAVLLLEVWLQHLCPGNRVCGHRPNRVDVRQWRARLTPIRHFTGPTPPESAALESG